MGAMGAGMALATSRASPKDEVKLKLGNGIAKRADLPEACRGGFSSPIVAFRVAPALRGVGV
jgi:hypothetical protein